MAALSVIGVLEISTVLLTEVLMEGALREAARYGVTGSGNDNREANIKRIVEIHTNGLVNMNTIEISTLIYNNFQSVGTSEPYDDNDPANGQYDVGESFVDVNENGVWDEDQGRDGVGQANEIVLYTIEYDAPAMTGFFARFFGEDGAIRLRTTLPLINEPF